MLYLGIDPGGSGGLALISERGKFVDFEAMPEGRVDLFEIILGFRERAEKVYRDVLTGAILPSNPPLLTALLEQITPQPARGDRPGWSHRGTASFFKNIGHLEMALDLARVPFEELRAQQWQPLVGLHYAKGEKRNKNRSKALVAEIFPTLENVTHAAADALLLAEACRRIHRGEPNGTAK
jgi:hypothetical protein